MLLLLMTGAVYVFRIWEERAPAVELTTIRGERIVLGELRGSPVLVNFWASDCRSCLAEIPALAELHRRYAPHGLTVIGVAMAYDVPSQVKAVADELKIPYPIALDRRGDHARAFAGVNLVPYSVLIAGDGRIVWRKLGVPDPEELQARIEQLLKEV